MIKIRYISKTIISWWSLELFQEAEEEQYRDILLFMELLTNLLSKDFIDLSPPDSQDTEDNVTAADVCLFGLNIIMPVIFIIIKLLFNEITAPLSYLYGSVLL